MEKFNKYFKKILATAFFTGYFPYMPGTAGTLVGAAVYALFSRYSQYYYISIIVIIVVSVWSSDYAERFIFKRKDSPHIVIDEVTGYLISMISFDFNGTAASIKYLVTGFILFRIFDIWKPYPIRQSQNLQGGIGIVTDDILAGIYTNLVLQFLRLTLPF